MIGILHFSTESVTATWLLPEMIERVSSMLNYFLNVLTGEMSVSRAKVISDSSPTAMHSPLESDGAAKVRVKAESRITIGVCSCMLSKSGSARSTGFERWVSMLLPLLVQKSAHANAKMSCMHSIQTEIHIVKLRVFLGHGHPFATCRPCFAEASPL